MSTILHDLRYALRMLLKSPGTTAVAVLSLALGIAATSTIFSVVNAVLLRPFPLPGPERLVNISGVNPQRAQVTTISSHDVDDWAASSRTIDKFAVWRDWGFTLTENNQTESFYSIIASPSLFDVLGVQPAAGRFFTSEDDQPGRNHVLVLSYSTWQRKFGGDRGVIGRTVHTTDGPYTVIGVMARNFELPSFDAAKLYAPHSVDPDLRLGRHVRNRRVWARLKDTATLGQAKAEIESLAAATARAYPDTNAGWGAHVESLTEAEVGDTRRPLSILFGAVAVVLLIACVNVVNLLLTRVVTRRGEFAIRLALGANPARLGRLLVSETLVLCAAGGALGVLLSSWSLQALIALAPVGTPRLEQVHIDGWSIAFAAALSGVIGVVVGLIPAWQAGRLNVEETLKESGRRAGTRNVTGNILVRIEIALAMLLLVGAALLAQSFLRLLAIPTDFRPDRILTMEAFQPGGRSENVQQSRDFFGRLRQAVKTVPGVQSVANASAGPYFGGYEAEEFVPADAPDVSDGKYPEARYYNISPNYFATLGIALLQGRDFTEADTRSSTPVVIISLAFAQRYWPKGDALGKRIRLVRGGDVLEVVGVAADVHVWPLYMNPQPEMYYAFAQQPRGASYMIVHTAADPAALTNSVRQRIWSVDANTVIGTVRTMREQMMRPLRRPRFNTILMTLFALLATVLSIVGVYGVISFATAQRTREIGVRIALGAGRGHVLRMVLAGSFRLIAVGIAAGAVAALASVRVLESMLYGVRATDPLTFAAVPVVLAAIALLACYFPARRATKVDPMEALRAE